MIQSDLITAVLDTNVILPIEIRDLLFWFAYDDLYIPKWSKHIFDEWKDVMGRRGVQATEIRKRIGWANMAFPNAMVLSYEPIIKTLKLPDENDCHVLAAAIKTNANIIVTNNLKDFPNDYLDSLGLVAKSSDHFLSDIIGKYPAVAIDSFSKLVENRKNPNLNKHQVIDNFRRNGLTKTSDSLAALFV